MEIKSKIRIKIKNLKPPPEKDGMSPIATLRVKIPCGVVAGWATSCKAPRL
jgi:hypothetical protein